MSSDIAATIGRPAHQSRPLSASSFETFCVGLIGLSFAWAIARRFVLSDATLILAFLFIPAAAMAIFETFVLKTFRRSSTGLDFSLLSGQPQQLRRVAVKVLAHWTVWFIVAVLYWILNFFPHKEYVVFYEFLKILAFPAILLTPIYIYFVDRFQTDPNDASYSLGCWLIGLTPLPSSQDVKTLLASYLLRAFFLPPLLSPSVAAIRNILSFSLLSKWGDYHLTFSFFLDELYVVDAVFGSIGYLFSSRILDTHVKNVYRYSSSYIVTMICYIPFNLFVPWPAMYEVRRHWDTMIPMDSWLGPVWAFSILLLWSGNELSNAIFGLRFSNLTNRGIVTAGPYKYCKHPAYLAKVLAWWMTFIPFVPLTGPIEAVRSTLLMCMISAIYYGRAKCEERELMGDPVYRQYSAYIDQNGAYAKLKRFCSRRFGLTR